MKQALKKNNYSRHLIRRGLRGVIIIKKVLNKSPNRKRNSSIKKNIFFTFTYYGDESTTFIQRIEHIIHKYLPHINVNISFKKTFALKDIFLPIQEGDDKRKKIKKISL